MISEFPMDDTQTVEKINSMSQELKNFGFSKDSADAMESAKSILMSDEEQKETRIFKTEEEVVVELSNKFKRFREMTTIKMQEMSRNIVNLHGQVKDLTETVNSSHSKKTIFPQKEPSPKPQEPVKKQSPQPAKHESQERSPWKQGENKEDYYEKQGHFTSEDVKIENIFYYGNK